MRQMSPYFFFFFVLGLGFPFVQEAQTGQPNLTAGSQPLRLLQTFPLPTAIKGHFDHFGVDLKHNRLFVTPEDFKAVLVLDRASGKLLHTIEGIKKPHAVLYREDLNRLYVTDGVTGALDIFDGDTYQNSRPFLC